MALAPEDFQFLKAFARALTLKPLDPDDAKYLDLYSRPAFQAQDPVALLTRTIAFQPMSSVQLLSGYRGSGKSTELRRLRKQLGEMGYHVVLIDIEDYLDTSSPTDITSFLIAICGAFGEALFEGESAVLKKHPQHETYWQRLSSFMNRTRIEPTELSASLAVANLSDGTTLGVGPQVKASLKTDPTFRQKLHLAMSTRLEALVADARAYLADCVKQVRVALGADVEVVLLVDSVEHFRGTSVTHTEVQRCMENVFANHASRLHFPDLHVVYTVPPYLKTLSGGISALYEPGGLVLITSLKIRDREGKTNDSAYEALEEMIAKRGDWKRLLGDAESMKKLVRYSGGHLRDLTRLLSRVIGRVQELPAPSVTVDLAIEDVRSELLPIPEDAIRWLDKIADTHQAAISDDTNLPRFASFLDTHLVLVYRNGEEWYDVHPLIAEHVRKHAESLRERERASSSK